jgi:hypothetical protein
MASYLHSAMNKATQIGNRFGLLVVLREVERRGRNRMVECACDCGATNTTQLASLLHRNVRSCGCLKRASNRTHGRSKTSEYGIWRGMLARCYNPKASRYAYYGGRGIAVCDRWRTSFEAFLADVGPRPSAGHSIDRRHNDGHYEPGNARWATRAEQAGNKRSSRHLTFNGRTQPMSDWSKETGIEYSVIRDRIQKWGWSVERALTTHRGRGSFGERSIVHVRTDLTAAQLLALEGDALE